MESWRRKEEKEKAKKCFRRNGGIFLEKLIADCNGISNPIRMFSSDQISEATNQFDPKCSFAEDGYFTCYKGDIEDRPCTMKMYTDEETAYNDIVLSARVSNHSCFLRLIGCCLEYPLPVLVFEYPEYGALNGRGTVNCDDHGPLLPWNVRLKIAKEVAIAITYLHTAFPRIIIHRDIKTRNVFLDKNGKAKLSNFALSVALPEGKSWIEDKVMGTPGYIDPVYCMTCVISEYTDVFSFGILMLVLLIGDPPYFYGSDLIGPNGEGIINWKFLEYVKDLHERGESVEFGGDPNDMRPDQMKMFLELALRCCEKRTENRPKMITVAKKIKLIEQGSFDCSEMLENETNCFLKDGSMSHQQLIADSNDISIVQMLSSNQISEATSHFDPKCYLGKEEETLRSKLMEFWRKKKMKGKAGKCFLRNGSVFLKELIADCNGISIPIRMFSSDQISKATINFDLEPLVQKSDFTCLTGIIEGRSYTIKIYIGEEEMSYDDVVLSARVSNHSGFLKLMGCCLEYPRPWLVFEDLDYTVLNERGTVGCEDGPLLPWNVRLKIAKEVATAITYLHTAFSRIIIHRNIYAGSVLLDKNGRAKLSDFSRAVTLPEGQSWLEEPVVGTYGYIDPNYYKTNVLTEYADVFSFGILMLVLLTGKSVKVNTYKGDINDWKFLEHVRDLHERGEPIEFGGDPNDIRPDQMEMFLELALRCCEDRSEDRPKMIMVAKEIKLIEKVPFDDSEMLENGRDCFLKDGSKSRQQLIADSNQISNATSHLDPKCYLGEEEDTLRSKLMEFWRRKKEKGKAKKCFRRNGGMFLEKLIADCNGISSPIKMFSSDQISKATNHFDLSCSIHEQGHFTWYNGLIEGRPYAIKKYTDRLYRREKSAYNDVVLSARVSDHIGFPKLMGSCLEFPGPVLVFEDLDYTVLNERGTVGCEDGPLLPWNVRLKIAKEVAIAITYLHTAFPRIIIHRNIVPWNVCLDKNGRAKLNDFSFAVTLPEGKSWIEDEVFGTVGHMDPVYAMRGLVREYTDVFSFGVLMLVLLIGRPAILVGSDGDWDPSSDISYYVKDLHERGETVVFGGDSNDMKPGQMKMFLELALRCCDWRSVDKPKMIMVAKEIKLIEKVPF